MGDLVKIPSKAGVKRLKRAPVSNFDGNWGGWLGFVLEIETARVVLRWKRGDAPMVWIPEKRAIVFSDCCSDAEPDEMDAEKTRDVEAVFAAWADRDVTKRSAFDLDLPANSYWESFGAARRIDYWSDKKNESVEYTHALEKGVFLYRYGRGARWLWMLRGGELTITNRGIEG